MSDLADFLLARIAEDEAVARNGVDRTYPGFNPWQLHNQLNTAAFGQPGPVIASRARILAECAAKRRMVEGAETIMGHEKTYAERMRHSTTEEATYVIAHDMLRSLTLPYADHPDYRDEWRA